MRLLQRSALGFAVHTNNLSENYMQGKAELKKYFYFRPNFAGKLISEVSCGFVRRVQINAHCSAVNVKVTVKKESLCMG